MRGSPGAPRAASPQSPVLLAARRGTPPPSIANPDASLHKNAVVWFVAFFLFALWAFWPSYFSHVTDQPEVRFHTHGIAMTLWCVLLIVEAYLIRTKQHAIHRQVGKASYVIVPLLIGATINLIHFRMKGGGTLPDIGLYQLALMLNAAVAFLVIYGLAIYYRRERAVHGRFMVCTVFPLFTPVTDRLIYGNWPSLATLVPTLDRVPLVQILGFALADFTAGDLARVGLAWKATHQRLRDRLRRAADLSGIRPDALSLRVLALIRRLVPRPSAFVIPFAASSTATLRSDSRRSTQSTQGF